MTDTASRYVNERGFWWHTGGGRFNHVSDCPTVHFSPEFLLHPRFDWEIDWSATPFNARLAEHWIATNAAAWLPKTTLPTIAGLKVKHVETGRIWILDGEYDYERNTYRANWPD